MFLKIWSRKISLRFSFGKFGVGKKVPVSISKNSVSEKKVSVSFKILVSLDNVPKQCVLQCQISSFCLLIHLEYDDNKIQILTVYTPTDCRLRMCAATRHT